MDENNKTIHTQWVHKTNGFILPVNFKNAASGNYTVEVTTNDGTINQTISYINGNDKVKEMIQLERVENRPYISLKSFMANGDPLKVVIFNKKSEVIFTETLEATKSFERIYKLDGFDSDYVGFSIYSQGNLVKQTTVEL
jgi:DUF2075 family protein